MSVGRYYTPHVWLKDLHTVNTRQPVTVQALMMMSEQYWQRMLGIN